jgi:ABC-type phosphate/phosphonate transport system substrate-binding protein
LVNSLFRDVPPALVQMMMPPFKNLLRDQTGCEGEVLTARDAEELAKRLSENRVDLGVFHGFEFAWVQEKYPDLKPLVVALNRKPTLKAFVMVRNDSEAASLADLKGQALSVPRRSLDHSLLFIDRECSALGCGPKEFFAAVVTHPNFEDALDDVIRGKVQAVVVDALALDSYEQVKPGCFARLKVLKESEPFPPAVLAYRDGGLDNETLGKFRDGLTTASRNVRAKELMGLWKITSFELPPQDFAQMLGAVLKSYPALPPAPATNGPK